MSEPTTAAPLPGEWAQFFAEDAARSIDRMLTSGDDDEPRTVGAT